MRHRTTPSTWRRRSRAALVGLTSLTLVLSGTASLATDGDDGAEVLEELISEPTLEPVDDAGAEATEDATEEPVAEPTDVPVPEEEPVAEPDAPAQPEVVEEPEAPAVEEPEDTGEVVPLDVPPGDPAPGQAKIIVRAAGDREGTGPASSSATPLEGVSFEILRFTEVPNPDETPTGVPVGTCTTDATGECGVFVDLPGQFDGSDAFFARMTGAPAGWVAPAQWGAAPGQEFTFWSDAVSADDPVADRIIELPLAFNETVTEPTAAAVRPNNEAPAQCGLDMAMVLDLSNSVTETEELLDEHKAAANDFIDAITGTPSQVALYTFGSEAPAAGPTNGGLPLTSVATPGSAQQIIDRINGYQATPSGGGGTNWDRAFHQVAESGVAYDVVLLLTDGQPTFHRDRQGPGDVSTIAEVNEAILSANTVKATGAQVVLIGFGPEAFLPGASIRIPLVSGPIEGEDFYRTDLENLSATLEEIASAECAGTLTVVKEVVDAEGDVVPGGAGWTFGTTTEGVTPTTATTDDSSAVNFEIDYTPTVDTRSVTVTETQQAGYELVPVDGANARCVTTGTGEVLPVTDSGDLGFTVDVAAADSVSCTVRNALVPPDYEDLVVSKTAVPSYAQDWDWDITKVAEEDRLEVPAGEAGTFTYDVTVTPTGPVDSGFTVSGTITIENPNDVPFTGVDVVDSLPDATCTVPGGTDATVPAGDSLTLSYSCALVGATPTTTGTNTATATWDAAAFPGTDGSATASVPFDFEAAAVTETDRYVTVTDSEYDLSDLPGGNAFDGEEGVQVLTYELTWPSVPGQCEDYLNTATVTNTIGETASAAGVNVSSSEIVTVCTPGTPPPPPPPPPTPDLSVDKTAVSADTRPDGDWVVVYEVTVTNESRTGGVYDLTDTLEFGGGITPLTAEWVLEGTTVTGEWTGLPGQVTTTLADGRPLAGGESETYVITVVADVAAGVIGTDESRCTGDEGTDGGGFLNAATLTAHGEESTDRDCLPPTHERLEKVFDSAVELDDGTWEVSYTLVVDNSHSPSDKYYRLDDVPLFAEGVAILGREAWDVTNPADPQDLGWDGEGPILEQAFIAAGEVQRYAVTFVVEVAADIPDENLVCGPEGPGRGFFNRAELTTGNDTIVDEDCGPIGNPAWTLTKSSNPVSGSTVDPGDTITYTVTATSTGDVAPTDLTVIDNLSDVVEHARPTGVVEASVGTVDWDGENLVWDIPTLSGTATLTYRVVVDDDAWNVRLRNVVTGEGPPPPVCIECTTTHITPPRRPGLPTTGAAVGGVALLAVLLSAGGITLATARRREED